MLLISSPDNCKVFSAIQAQGNGNSRLVRGICDGILGYLGQRALPTGGLVLTWDPNRRKERDAYTCNKWNPGGKSYCTVQDQQLKADLGITSKEYIISCDEFPFGGVEEGGEFGARYAQPRIPPTANCVPRWQQDIQGHCNRMFPSYLLSLWPETAHLYYWLNLLLTCWEFLNDRNAEFALHKRGILRPRRKRHDN